MDDFAAVFFDEREPGEKLQPILRRAIGRWHDKPKEEREDFRSLVQSFVRLYAYVSQLISFVDPDLEKLYVFAHNLSRKLPRREGAGLPQEILDEVDLDSFRIQETYQGELKLESEDGEVYGIPTESGGTAEPEKDYLSNIVTALNDVHGLDLDERDRERVKQIVEDVEQDEDVQAVMRGPNSKSNKRHRVNSVIDKQVQAQVNDAVGFYQKLIDEETNKAFKRHLFAQLLQQFAGETTLSEQAPSE